MLNPTSTLDSKNRRKQLDQRRMEFRRAIEAYSEQRQLQQELDAYPDLIALNYLSGSLGDRRSAPPAH
ncbi:PA3496 family putative envelope integrity protein [Pseudomonas sp.]|uniref:PA3496 family putative envelope integrity protein n=1 Tax=Pseudomonas sp. TaxID=306 RepID=UPI0028A871FE|nr:hypothetical protein [Pseudomonas sp.]